jgi:hypothetical protein
VAAGMVAVAAVCGGGGSGGSGWWWPAGGSVQPWSDEGGRRGCSGGSKPVAEVLPVAGQVNFLFLFF